MSDSHKYSRGATRLPPDALAETIREWLLEDDVPEFAARRIAEKMAPRLRSIFARSASR